MEGLSWVMKHGMRLQSSTVNGVPSSTIGLPEGDGL